MELELDNRLIDILQPDNNDIIVLTAENIHCTNNKLISNLENVINTLGNDSARVKFFFNIKAQSLKGTITNWSKFLLTDQKIFLKLDGNKAIGFIKIGVKKLFFWNEMNKIKELKPLCLLDFYVNENYQRNGFGKVSYFFYLF
jgi:hypothetical protein